MIMYRSSYEFGFYSTNNYDDMSSFSDDTSNIIRKFKLPKLEMKKFYGDVKNWMAFWGQVQKIYGDNSNTTKKLFESF